MSPAASRVLEEALTLQEEDRVSVAGALIESLKGSVGLSVEELWDREILRRVEELDSGAVRLIPWSEVRQRLHHGLG